MVRAMPKRDINQVVAENLNYFMQRAGSEYRNANALGDAADVAPNTIRYYLHPKKRPLSSAKGAGYPVLDTLARLAGKLGCEVWELLHPDLARSFREREMYKTVESDFMAVQRQNVKTN